MNSLQLTQHLYKVGSLSKIAAVRVLRQRDQLVKKAMEDWTKSYFGFEKSAIFGSGWLSRGGPPPAPAGKSPTKVVLPQSLKNIAPLLALAGLVSLGTTGTRMGLGALADIKTSKELKRSYRDMFKEYPDLKEDKGQATKYFSLMSKYAPSLATSPILAGTWIKQMMNMNVVDAKNIHSLIEAQNEWEKVRTMKSPLVGFTQEMPRATDILKQVVSAGTID